MATTESFTKSENVKGAEDETRFAVVADTLPAKNVSHEIVEVSEEEEAIEDLLQSILSGEAVEDVFVDDITSDDILAQGSTTWKNCIGEQTCDPKEKRNVKVLKDLITAVQDGMSKKLRVRAVGSGHSFSNVCPTDGILLDPHGMKAHLPFDRSVLKSPDSDEKFVSVKSGITIKDLNTFLDGRGLALATMGAYDGQTLAGAISTGTHGSGKELGPIASLVRSMVLVSETGSLYQIEPSDGITDAEKFQEKFKDGITDPEDPQSGPFKIELKQDDDWFRSTLIAMGCMGLIYSYTLSVVPSFLLRETRTVTTWQDLKPQLASGLSSDLLRHRYFEIDINPYKTWGKNVAVSVVRDIPLAGTPISKKSRGATDWLSGIVAKFPILEKFLIGRLNRKPQLSPGVIAQGLRTLANRDWVNKSHVVLNLGNVNKIKAYAVELSFDANRDVVGTVDRIIATFEKAVAEKVGYIAGPFSLRFVAASEAYAAPQQGRTTMMVEMDMLVGIKTGKDLLKYVKKNLCSGSEGMGVRVHWGLDLDTVTKDEVAGMFPEWDKWLGVYRTLNSSGMWNSKFTDRLGISM